MISFLFWNINKNPNILSLVSESAKEFEADVILLAECSIPISRVLNDINRNSEPKYYYAWGNCERIVLLTRFSPDFARPIIETDRVTVRHLNLPGLTDILLVATHHISKAQYSYQSQYDEAVILSRLILEAEKTIRHSRTILIGDLNMNPFEGGVVSASALHAIGSRKIADKKFRKIRGNSYPFFYNPMWNLFGDRETNSPGTYYYNSSDYEVVFWNIFDQVLIRPDLIDRFSLSDLAIVTHAGTHPLVSRNGIPRKKMTSDHLPIIFKLDL